MTTKYKILTLNDIAVAGLDRLPRDRYEVASELPNPDAILVRSRDMHALDVPASLKAVARAGAGVNNVPVEALSERGIPVFNAPGANANAVKELTVAGILIAARNLCQAWAYVRELDGDDAALRREVEAGKKRFRGFELPARTLGVIGLGAVGVKVANVAVALGMRVIGFDAKITVRNAWQLSSRVEQAASVGDVLAQGDFVSVHVPLTESTYHLVNAARVATMRNGATLLNFARDGIVDEDAVLAALDAGLLNAYVCDFPSNRTRFHPRVITLPHLGASTDEATDNCAIMVADQLRAFLEDGNVSNSVNFPEVVVSRNGGYRVSLVNANMPNMLGQISTTLANAGLNILNMINRSRGPLAYTLADVASPLSDQVIEQLAGIEGVMSVRAL